jgi:hypothetical protein
MSSILAEIYITLYLTNGSITSHIFCTQDTGKTMLIVSLQSEFQIPRKNDREESKVFLLSSNWGPPTPTPCLASVDEHVPAIQRAERLGEREGKRPLSLSQLMGETEGRIQIRQQQKNFGRVG